MMNTEKAEVLTLKKGEVIFEKREEQNWMYDILWGKVGIYADYGTPGQKLLAELNAEEFFGEMGLIEGRARSATAVALEKGTRVKVITAETFEDYFKARPAKVITIMQHMSHRLRVLTKDYMEACGAVNEAVTAEAENKPKSEGLKARLKQFAAAYASASQDVLANGGRLF